MFDVAQLSPVYCTQYVQDILQNIQEQFVQQREKKGTVSTVTITFGRFSGKTK